MLLKSSLALLLLRSSPTACARAPVSEAPVTIAVVNARAWTGDPRRPWADAIAVRGERIAAVGSSAEIRKLAGRDARVIDARGMMLVPGFIDSHIHFIDGGFGLASVQLRDARTPSEFIARIKAFAASAPPGTWITEGNWDHELWGGELPRRDWIDSVTPNAPVWVNRLDGHMGLANSAALRAAGVTRATAEIDGGTIVRDAAGDPTGVLKDNAMGLVARAVPPPSNEQVDRALDAAMRFVAEQGVTSIHHMGTWNDLAAFERAHAAGRLRTRIYAAVPLADLGAASRYRRGARPRRRVAQARRAQGIRRRLARLAHRGVLRAVLRCAERSRLAREHARRPLRVDRRAPIGPVFT